MSRKPDHPPDPAGLSEVEQERDPVDAATEIAVQAGETLDEEATDVRTQPSGAPPLAMPGPSIAPVAVGEEDDLTTEDEPTAPGLKVPQQPSLGRRAWRLVRDWGLTLLAVVVVWQVVGMWRAPDLPDQAPAFTLADLDGERVSLADQRGRTVILNFWADWCMPCRAEIPSFSRYAREHPDVVVFGIATDGTPESIRRSARDLGIDYTVLVGDRATIDAYGVTTLPTTVVVGPEGDVRYAHTGIMLGPQIAWAARQ